MHEARIEARIEKLEFEKAHLHEGEPRRLEQQRRQLRHEAAHHERVLAKGAYNDSERYEHHVQSYAPFEALCTDQAARKVDQARHERLGHLDEGHGEV